MQRLKSVYAMRFHHRHHTSGHLFKRPYHSRPILTAEQLHRGCGYTLRNPVRHGLVDRAEDWEWSSFRTVARLAPPLRSHLGCQPFVQLLGLTGTTKRLAMMRAYVRDSPAVRNAIPTDAAATGASSGSPRRRDSAPRRDERAMAAP
jgi:putative transposase